jgi:5-methylcytosine-specific restriction endonuclease McrA
LLASPESCPALVLNADFRPLSYFPLSVWPWQEAVKAVFLDRVNIVSEYDRVVHSPSLDMALPSVISLKQYVPTARRPAFTRFNVFLRDRFSCQYCGTKTPSEHLTFDHVIPKSRGGLTTWDNVVAACEPCNLKKGGLMPRDANMVPKTEPSRPTVRVLQAHGRAYPPNFLHESWRDFLYWDSELEAG